MSLGSTKSRDAAVGTRRVVPRGRAARKAPRPRRMLAVWGSPIVRLVRAHPGKAAAIVLLGTLMTGIVGNAVLFQHGHHPAPLFAGAPPAGVPALDSPVGSVPLPTPRPSDLSSGAGTPAAAAPGTDPVPTSEPAPAAKPATVAKRKTDGIAALLRDEPAAAGATPKPLDATVLQAQRALEKLGYDIKPDGHMGTATRKALDTFAAEHHVAGMTGTLTPKLLHDLTLAAAKPPVAKPPVANPPVTKPPTAAAKPHG